MIKKYFSTMRSSILTAFTLILFLSLALPKAISASGRVGTISHAGFLPSALALDETRNRLFVFDRATSSIFIYNATTLEELDVVSTTLDDSVSMVIDESAGKLYAGHFGPGVDIADGIAVINVETATLIKYLPSGGYTYLIKDESLNVVYASSNYYGVRIIDIVSDVLTTINGINANLYTSMDVNPVTHEIFISNWSQNDGNFFIVDPTTLAVTTVPDMNGFGVAVNWIENKAYVSYCQPGGWEAVCIFDRDTNTKTSVHTTNDSTQPMVFNPTVNHMFTNTEVNRIATIFNSLDDTYINVELTGGLGTVGVRYSSNNVYYVNQSGTYVMNGHTREIVAEFPEEGSCTVCGGAIVINQTTGVVYIINDDSLGKVVAIQDGVFLAPSCSTLPVPESGEISGALTTTDCHSPLRNEQSYWKPYYADRYSINLTSGQKIKITLAGDDAYEYLYLLGPSENVILEASGGYFDPAIIPSSGFFTISEDGTYVIEVTSVYSNDVFGQSEWPYTLTITIEDPPPFVTSITRTSTSPTSSTSVDFTVTFSEDVTGVDTNGSDFTLTTSSGLPSAVITGVTPVSASVYTVTVNTGAGSGTLLLNVPVSASIQDLSNNALSGLPFTSGEVYTKIVSATFKSNAANDGWILESSETSNTGGTLNSAQTTFTLGDDAADKQYRAILHFDTSALPDTAVVTNMTLKIKQQGNVTGTSPFTFGSLYVDMRNPAFGGSALEPTDFNFAAKKVKPAVFNPTPVSGWFSARFNTGGNSYVNRTGVSQLRLYFSVDDNNNNIADLIRFYSGNASAGDRPKLLITYYVP